MADDPADNGGQGYAGQAGITAPGSGHNTRALQHRIQQDARRTSVVVKVLKVYPDPNGGTPTADVQPMTDQADGLNNATPHGPVFGVAVGRPHSGSGAFVSDPVAGDLYLMNCADRDISGLKRTGAQQQPSSDRRGSMADGVLTHAVITKAPKQAFMHKPGGGVKIFDEGGAVIETSADGKTVTVMPAPGGTLILGGTGSDGTYGFVQTDQGTSTVVKAKL